MSKNVFCIYGPQGSGKSTVANNLMKLVEAGRVPKIKSIANVEGKHALNDFLKTGLTKTVDLIVVTSIEELTEIPNRIHISDARLMKEEGWILTLHSLC